MRDRIIGLFQGQPKPFFDTQSSIRRDQVDQINVGKHIIENDECFDKKHHGGDKRVIHNYSLKNYERLKQALPEIAEKFNPGTYGENLCSESWNETQLCIGDIVKIGNVTVQLTIPRTPCSTINATYEHKGVLKEIVKNSHYGWFYQILEAGTINQNDSIELIDRLYPKLNLYKLILASMRREKLEASVLEQAIHSNILDEEWIKKVSRINPNPQ